MRERLFIIAVVVALGSFAWADEDDEYLFSANLGDDYLSAVNRVARELRTSQYGQIAAAGRRISEQLLAGGRVYLYDRHDALWAESRSRAGGLPGLLPYRPRAEGAAEPGRGDLLIVYQHTLSGNETNLVRRALARGVKVIVAFPMIADDPRTLDLLRLDVLAIDSGTGTGRGALTAEAAPRRLVGSLSAPGSLLLLWALLTEVCQQMMTRGQLPAVFASDLTEAGRQANRRLAALPAARRRAPMRIPLVVGPDDEPMAVRYLTGMYHQNGRLSSRVIFTDKPPYPLETAVDPSLAAAKAGRVFHWDASPVVRRLLGGKTAPGRPAFVRPLAGADSLRAGDVLWLGSASGDSAEALQTAKAAKGKGAKVIAFGGPAASGGAAALAKLADVYLSLGTPAADGILTLPGTKTPIGPVTTVLQLEGFWMLALRTYQKLQPPAPKPPPASGPAEPAAPVPGPFGG
jgi:uncharacterized phosphosugar-binding protein